MELYSEQGEMTILSVTQWVFNQFCLHTEVGSADFHQIDLLKIVSIFVDTERTDGRLQCAHWVEIIFDAKTKSKCA